MRNRALCLKLRPPLLTLRDVSYAYRSTPVLRSVSLTLSEGETVLVVGKNGSGKSTLLALLASLVSPLRGERIVNRDLHTIGYYAHTLLLYLDFTPLENLTLFSRLLGLPPLCTDDLEPWGLTEAAHRPLRELSQGTQAKVALCRSLLGDPRLLLLDEPTATLDAGGVEYLREVVRRRVEEGRTTVIATHEAERFGQLPFRILTVHSGTVHCT